MIHIQKIINVPVPRNTIAIYQLSQVCDCANQSRVSYDNPDILSLSTYLLQVGRIGPNSWMAVSIKPVRYKTKTLHDSVITVVGKESH